MHTHTHSLTHANHSSLVIKFSQITALVIQPSCTALISLADHMFPVQMPRCKLHMASKGRLLQCQEDPPVTRAAARDSQHTPRATLLPAAWKGTLLLRHLTQVTRDRWEGAGHCVTHQPADTGQKCTWWLLQRLSFTARAAAREKEVLLP